VTNIFLLDGGWLRVYITGHPSSSISPSWTPYTTTAPPGRVCHCCGYGCQQLWEKKFKNTKKNFILYSVYIKVYKKLIFCLKKRILYFEYFPAFKINKSHCSSEFLIFLFLNKIFVINAGIEPAFSVKFGNRTRI
jgi:hypothetical protein